MPNQSGNSIKEDLMSNRPPVRDDTNTLTFIDIAAALWKHKAMMIGVELIVVLGALIYLAGSIVLPADQSYLPNLYTVQATLIVRSGEDGSSTTSAALSIPEIRGLEELAGRKVTETAAGGISGLLAVNNSQIDTFNNDNGSLAQVLATSNTTLDLLDDKFGFSNRTKKRKESLSILNTRNSIKKHLEVEFDPITNLLNVSFIDFDPEVARNVVNEIIRILEERLVAIQDNKLLEAHTILEKKLLYIDGSVMDLKDRINKSSANSSEIANLQGKLQSQTELLKILTQQNELIKLNMVVMEPVLKVLEEAEVPYDKSGPSRGILLIWAIMAGFFLAVFLVVLVEAIGKIKTDPDSAARFRALSSKKTIRGRRD